MPAPKADQDLSKAHPLLRERVEKLLAFMETIGHPVFITECWRSRDRQAWLYAQGRDRPGDIVTNALPGTSKHEYMHDNGPCALACDVAFDCAGQTTVKPWDDAHPWGVLAMVAEELCGLQTLSKWNAEKRRFYGDRPHVEISL